MRHHEGWRRRDVLRAAGLLGLGAIDLSPAMAATAEPLNIIYVGGSVTPVFEQLMASGNYFKQFGVDTTIADLIDGSKVIAALVSGHADLCGGSGFSGVFPAIEKGAEIKIVAGTMLHPQNALVSRRPDIVSSRDLIGKTVGVGALGALLHQLAVALMVKQGVDYTKVNFRNVGGIVDVFKAVVAGTVDAGFGPNDVYDQPQYGAHALTDGLYGAHALTDGLLWDELPTFTNQAMIATNRAIAEKRDQLVRALAAHAKLYRFIVSRDSKAAWFKARIAGLNKDEPQEAEKQWKFFNTPGMLATDLVLAPEQFEFVQQLNVTLGAQDHVLPFDKVADMSIARDALKLLS